MTTPRRRLQRIAAAFNAKARRYGVPGVVSGEMLASLGNTCAYCGVELGSYLDGNWDHRVPFHRGGTNDLSNIARCCQTDNRRKFTKTVTEYEEHQGMIVTCALPGCGVTWQPRYAEAKRGMARYCSRSHAAKSRWVH